MNSAINTICVRVVAWLPQRLNLRATPFEKISKSVDFSLWGIGSCLFTFILNVCTTHWEYMVEERKCILDQLSFVLWCTIRQSSILSFFLSLYKKVPRKVTKRIAVGTYSYTSEFYTFKNYTFKSVIFKSSRKWFFGSSWHFWVFLFILHFQI